MKYIPTIDCASRLHCRACRQNAAFRAGWEKRFGPFDCPLAIPIGATEGFPEPVASKAGPPPAPRKKCRHMEDTGEKVPDRPCYGTWIVCHNAECPMCKVENGKALRGWASHCQPEKCRFFSEGKNGYDASDKRTAEAPA
jgi:hypothetical protein